jgi:hypothetical protein
MRTQSVGYPGEIPWSGQRHRERLARDFPVPRPQAALAPLCQALSLGYRAAADRIFDIVHNGSPEAVVRRLTRNIKEVG